MGVFAEVQESWNVDGIIILAALGLLVVLGIAALVVYLLTRGPGQRGED